MAPDNNAVPAACPTVAQSNRKISKRRPKRPSGFSALHIRRRLKRFISDNHQAVLEYAWRITRDLDLAERAVAETYVEVLEGRAVLLFFKRALKMNARDLLEHRGVERNRCERLDAVLARRVKSEKYARSGPESDLPSPRPQDCDPLDLLIEQEEQAATKCLVQAAKRDRNWRNCKRRQWAQSLVDDARNLPPRPNRRGKAMSRPKEAILA